MTSPRVWSTEHYLVGAALLSEAARDVLVDVQAEEISDPEVGDIVRVIQDLAALGHATDVPSVAAELRQTGSTVGFVDVQAMADLVERAGSAEMALHYRDILRDQNRDRAVQHGIRALFEKVTTDPRYDFGPELDALLLRDRTQGVPTGAWLRELTAELAGSIQSRMAGSPDLAVLSTGWSSIDTTLHGGGLHPGELVILGGRPGAGKTLFAVQLAMNVARRREPVLFVSAEMTARAIARRMAISFTGLPAWAMDKVGAIAHPWDTRRDEAVERITNQLGRLPIYLHDASRPTAAVIKQTFRRHGPFRLVIVDYTSLMGEQLGGDSEERRMAAITLGLQQLARDLGVPVVALHQLSRAVESAPKFRPAMAHLRDSGQVEANAHLVWLLYRRDYYVAQGRLDNDGTDRDLLEVIVAKNRDGETGTVKLHFDAARMRLSVLGEQR